MEIKIINCHFVTKFSFRMALSPENWTSLILLIVMLNELCASIESHSQYSSIFQQLRPPAYKHFQIIKEKKNRKITHEYFSVCPGQLALSWRFSVTWYMDLRTTSEYWAVFSGTRRSVRYYLLSLDNNNIIFICFLWLVIDVRIASHTLTWAPDENIRRHANEIVFIE